MAGNEGGKRRRGVIHSRTASQVKGSSVEVGRCFLSFEHLFKQAERWNTAATAGNEVTTAVNDVTMAVNEVTMAVNEVTLAVNEVTTAVNEVTTAVNIAWIHSLFLLCSHY